MVYWRHQVAKVAGERTSRLGKPEEMGAPATPLDRRLAMWYTVAISGWPDCVKQPFPGVKDTSLAGRGKGQATAVVGRPSGGLGELVAAATKRSRLPR